MTTASPATLDPAPTPAPDAAYPAPPAAPVDRTPVDRTPVDRTPVDEPPVACVECGGAVAERFCPRCGEARPVPGALAVRHLAADAVEQVTSLDVKLLRTLATLVLRPGQLTVDFVAGRRARYTRPLALYVFATALLFVVTDALSARVTRGRGAPPPSAPLAVATPSTMQAIARRAAQGGEPAASLIARVRASPLASWRAVNLGLVPALTLALSVLLARRRRLLAEHVLTAVYFQAFLLVGAVALMALSYGAGYVEGRLARTASPGDGRGGAGVLFAAVVLIGASVGLAGHLYASLRRAYQLRRGQAAWRAVMVVLLLPLLLAGLRNGLLVLAAAVYAR